MKKNKMMRIASVLLVAVLLSTCAISGTFAKYASEFVADDTVHVAKWSASATDKGSSSFTFDLFKTIKSTDDSAEENVAENMIAPGTQGEFAIVLAADSEVTYTWNVEFDVTNDDIVPIEFSLDKTNWGDLETLDDTLTGTVIVGGTQLNQEITVYWRWLFNDTRDDDSYVYSEGNSDVTVDVTVNFEQVD